MPGGMNGDQMAAEVIQAIQALGGHLPPQSIKAFKALCNAIVLHIQTNLVVNAAGTAPPGGGPVTTISTTVL